MRIQIQQAGQGLQPATLTSAASLANPVNLVIQNVSAAANIFVSSDAQAVNIVDSTSGRPTSGLILGPNQIISFPGCWKAPLYAVADGAGAYAEVQEVPA